MKAQNFTWSDGTYLCAEGKQLDLHNDFDFWRFSYDVNLQSVTLHWRRRSGDWVTANLPDEICLNISGVYYCKYIPRNPKYPGTDDACLASFGYDCDDDWADGQFWTDEPAEPSWRWSFEFQSGSKIVIGGEEASVDFLVNER